VIPFEPSSALYRRPTLLNWLHALRLAKAHTQTNGQELECLRQYSHGQKIALEIGTHMGVSARFIAEGLDPEGRLFCVDPWEPRRGRENPCWTICRRELQRNEVISRVVFVQGFSHEIENILPPEFDFIFVDGDHSYEGLERDWGIVGRHSAAGTVVCLHDTAVPRKEPYRVLGAVTFFNEVVRHDPRFRMIDCCYSMNVLRRISQDE
jgi:predicted O-methyltransferase YrrM